MPDKCVAGVLGSSAWRCRLTSLLYMPSIAPTCCFCDAFNNHNVTSCALQCCAQCQATLLLVHPDAPVLGLQQNYGECSAAHHLLQNHNAGPYCCHQKQSSCSLQLWCMVVVRKPDWIMGCSVKLRECRPSVPKSYAIVGTPQWEGLQCLTSAQAASMQPPERICSCSLVPSL